MKKLFAALLFLPLCALAQGFDYSYGSMAFQNAGSVAITGGSGAFSGVLSSSVNGALSAPGATFTGTWITGGSATTNKPYVLIETAGASSAAWSTVGTGIGVNAATGFTGNLLDLQLNGVSNFSINRLGTVTSAGSIIASSFVGTLANSGGSSNSSIQAGTTGASISRNVADSNPTLTVTQSNASSTGDIVRFSNSAGIQVKVTQAGLLQIGGVTVNVTLTGTTGSIGGGALIAGQCTSGTVAVTSSTTSMVVGVSPNTYPGDGVIWYGYVSANGTVTVKVCGIIAVTPTSSTYNVRVVQ